MASSVSCAGEVGEVTLAAGEQLFSGYEGESARAGYFRTGDLGRIDADGWLFLSGRVREVRRSSRRMGPLGANADIPCTYAHARLHV